MGNSKDGLKIPLAQLSGTLLAHLWPAERVVVGLRVCSWVREHLLKNAESVVLLAGRITSPHDVQHEDLCGDLVRFQHRSLKVEIRAKFCELLVEIIFAGMRNLNLARWAGQIVFMDFGSCGINSDGAQDLANILQQHRALKHLILSRNCIGDQGVAVLAAELRNCHDLEELDLGHNCVRSDGARRLGELFQHCPALEHLSVCWNRIGDEGLLHIAQTMHCTKLKHLDVCKNNIGETGALQLSKAMVLSPTLTHLDISRNFLGNDGFSHISAALATSHSLKHLDLGMNYAGAAGAKTLAGSLAHCTALTHLGLASNNFGDDGVMGLADGLQASVQLRRVDLWGNNVLDDVRVQFERLPMTVNFDAVDRSEVTVSHE